MVVKWDDQGLDNLTRAAEYALEATAADVVIKAQEQLYHGHGLLTGNLRSSIQYRPIDLLEYQVVAYNVNYGVYVEARYKFLSSSVADAPARLLFRLKEVL